MICVYDYLIVFGGQGENGQIYGDLWVFDIRKADWIRVMDTDKVHELKH